MLVAVNCSIPSSLLPSPPDLEVASVKLGLNKELILCTIYVPPNSSESYLTSLFTYLSDLTCSPNQCLIVGDFNPDICWSSLMVVLCCPIVSVSLFFDCNLTQHVMEPTHFNGNILDLVLYSDRVNVDGLNIFRSVLIHSDHLLLVLAVVVIFFLPLAVNVVMSLIF